MRIVFWFGLLSQLVLTLFVAGSLAQESPRPNYLRIGTGATGGTYYPIGAAIANAVSLPPGSTRCGDDEGCGVPGLIAVAAATDGSVANIKGMENGNFESALVQADIAHWAYEGIGLFAGGSAYPSLRAIANLYPEAVHVVVRGDSDLTSISDLKGRRVNLAPVESGTYAEALTVMVGYGVAIDEITPSFLPLGAAVDELRSGQIDALFAVGGVPIVAIERLSQEVPLRLLPVEGGPAARLIFSAPFYRELVIPAGTYSGAESSVPTIAIGAQWVVTDKMSDELAFGLTSALWNEKNRAVIEKAHPQGRNIKLESALNGLGVPLHDGARRYYREIGLIE